MVSGDRTQAEADTAASRPAIDSVGVVERVVVADVPQAGSDRVLSSVFGVAVFLSSTLLFLVQPLAARLLLPLVGGSAALWNTAMVFFQVALLLGYAYAHGSIRRSGARRHTFLQLPLLALPLVVLPLSVPTGWSLPGGVSPSIWVLGTLAVVVGLPFFALATTSPTLQVWFSSTDHARAADPYFLYATGNVGSVLALLGYPLVMEPLFSLRMQTRIWAGGYVLFVLACLAAGVLTRRRQNQTTQEIGAQRLEPLEARRRLRWLFWGFVPSALMLGVTLHISTDLASFPLLWVVPLLLYLVTFIVAFGGDSPARTRRTKRFVIVAVLPVLFLSLAPQSWTLLVLGGHLAWFFGAALLCHSKLAEDRPNAGHLTEFFLILSTGGALGGVFASLIAPRIFVTVVEYPIAIALVLFIAVEPARALRSPALHACVIVALVLLAGAFVFRPSLMVVAGIAAALLASISFGPRAGIIVMVAMCALMPLLPYGGDILTQQRSFFGVYIVRDFEAAQNDPAKRLLISGTTTHGVQVLDTDGPARPASYYHDGGPVGEVIKEIGPSRVGVVGLGAGTIAAYGQAGDDYVFWEIDQLVVDIAHDESFFTFLRDSEADVEVLVDDGRHGVDVSRGNFDLIVIDAFGSDAIPVHLLTAEAIELYLDRLAPDGTVMIHISNRHFDLAPIVGSGAKAAGSQGFGYQYVPSLADSAEGALPSYWTAIPARGGAPAWQDSGLFVPLDSDGTVWTDDYSNVLSALKLTVK